MNQIQMWQLFVDIGLITSVLTLTTRAFKASRLPGMLPKTRELESSLRGLINEAEGAGVHLNDQLLRREQNIQKALAEIQQSEARIAQTIADAESLLSKLQLTRNETVRVISDLKHGFERGIQSELTRFDERSAQAPSAEPQSARAERVAQAPRLEPEAAESESDFVQQSYPRAGLQRSVEQEIAPQRPLAREAAAPPAPKAEASAPKTSELQRIYQSAEAMIKEGQGVETVASRMKLPVEGVRLLAEMIEIEREEDSRKQDPNGKLATTDSRLGALASIRRQTSVL